MTHDDCNQGIGPEHINDIDEKDMLGITMDVVIMLAACEVINKKCNCAVTYHLHDPLHLCQTKNNSNTKINSKVRDCLQILAEI